MKIKLPHKFNARPYQKEVFKADADWYKRFILVWHRRAWKDKTALQLLIKWAMQDVWVYYYVFPEYAQGRKIFWDWIDNDWFRNIDHIPKELIKNTSDQQMKIELVNWSLIQVIGTDRKIDNIVWTNPKWCIFSEFPISDPRGWDLIRPILTVNGWKAIFVYTPRWKNHWFKLYQVWLNYSEKWYVSLKTVNDTTDNEWNSIVKPEMIEDERRSWMDEDLIQQEYYCSFDASIKWAYYSDQMKLAREQNRITTIPYEKSLEVHTFWDLWYNDTTAIWFVQFLWKEIRIIDHLEMSWQSLDYYIWELKAKWYKYWTHYLPHDAQAKTMQTWMSVEDRLRELWINNYKITSKLSVNDWIDAVRRIFQYCWFDKQNCERWLNALNDYHKEWDDKNQIFRDSPKHDRASNSADAFRYLAVNYKDLTNISYEKSFTVDYSDFV